MQLDDNVIRVVEFSASFRGGFVEANGSTYGWGSTSIGSPPRSEAASLKRIFGKDSLEHLHRSPPRSEAASLKPSSPLEGSGRGGGVLRLVQRRLR